MLSAHPNLELYLIDNFKEPDALAARDMAFERLAPFGERAVFMIEDSVLAASHFDDETFDYVYIDGCHNEEAVINDIRAWRPKVKHTGILAGHDYNQESVQRAVKKFADNETILFVPGEINCAETSSDWMLARRD